MSGYKELLFGKIVIKNNLASSQQVQECLKIQMEKIKGGGNSPTLGEIMIQRGYLTKDQVEKVLLAQSKTAKVQKNYLYGVLAIKNNFASKKEILECLNIQKESSPPRRLGAILLEKGYIEESQHAAILKAQDRIFNEQVGNFDIMADLQKLRNRFHEERERHPPKEEVSSLERESGEEIQEELRTNYVESQEDLSEEELLDQPIEKPDLLDEEEEEIEVLEGTSLEEESSQIKALSSEAASPEIDKSQPERVSEEEKEKEEIPEEDKREIVRIDDRGDTQLLGDLAIKKGLITIQQLQSCLKEQTMARKKGDQISLEEVLHQMNYINEEEVELLKQELIIQNPRQDLIANFEIEEKIGQGAMGVVYKARDIMGQTVALKVLLPKYTNDKKFYTRFMREGYIATTLNHTNIVKAYEVGISEEYVYFSMEYIEGETVKKILDKNYSIPPHYALYIVSEIAKALECAWKSKLVHRDVKPDNIIITRKGEVKLCDLGIAKEINVQKPHSTPTDKIMGTPYYVSPELVKGDNEIDIRSDIYSLGVAFYHMVVGEVPFDGETSPRIMVKHVLEKALPPIQRRPELPLEVSNLIMKMMEKEIDKRFQTPAGLLQALKKVAPKVMKKGEKK